MTALLVALTGASRGRKRSVALLAGATTLLGTSGVAWASWQEARAQQCSSGQEQIDALWGTERRHAVERAMLATGEAGAADAWGHVASAIDDYAARWASEHREACEATTVREEQTAEDLDLRMACLQRAKNKLTAMTELFADADAQTVSRAQDVVAGLLPLSRCSDTEALAAEVAPPDEEDRAVVDALRMDVSRAEVLFAAGKYREVIALVEEMTPQVERLGYAPMRTLMSMLAAGCYLELGKSVETEAAYREAIVNGMRARQWTHASFAAGRLILHLAQEQGRFSEARALIPLAFGLVNDDGLNKAEIHQQVGLLYANEGRVADAERESVAVLELLERLPKVPDAEIIELQARGVLTWVYERRGQREAAIAEQRIIVEGFTRLIGREHPMTIGETIDLGRVLNDAGEHEQALEVLRAVLSFAEEHLDPEHPRIGDALNNLGAALVELGRHAEARAVMQRALAFWAKKSHPIDTAYAHEIDGYIHDAGGRHAQAEAAMREALRIRTENFGPDHDDVGRSRWRLARVLHHAGRDVEALNELAAAETILVRNLGEQHEDVVALRELRQTIVSADAETTRPPTAG